MESKANIFFPCFDANYGMATQKLDEIEKIYSFHYSWLSHMLNLFGKLLAANFLDEPLFRFFAIKNLITYLLYDHKFSIYL